jgi:hypothetical protein
LNDFEKGWLMGSAASLAGMGLWTMLAFGWGVHGDSYDWPYLLFRTNVWVASDVLLTVFLFSMTALAFSHYGRKP